MYIAEVGYVDLKDKSQVDISPGPILENYSLYPRYIDIHT